LIKFKTIRWKNLLSTGNVFTEVRLDDYRTTLIIGINGSGKSTILDALMFVLFNKPFRKVNKGQLINSISGKMLVVEIEFEKGDVKYMVRRGSKPNIFEIYKNGTLVDQSSENKDYQAYLEGPVLGMSQKAFAQVVILGAASFIPFMQLTPAARREVIEDILDIQIFSDMNVLLKARISDNNKLLSEANHNVQMALTKLDMAREVNAKQAAGNQSQIDDQNKKIEEISSAALELVELMEGAQRTLDEIKVDSKEVERLSKNKREMEDELLGFKKELVAHQKSVDFYQKHDECPTCKQEINDILKALTLRENEEAIAVLVEKGKKWTKDIAKLEEKLNVMFELTKTIKKQESLIAEYEREIGWYQQQVETCMTTIADLEKAGNKQMIEIEPLEMELKDKQSALEVRKEHTKVLDAAYILLKDGGIKSVIIKQYIPVINSLINKYLTQMDFYVDFQINETFEETIKSRHRDEFSYESFSEGEKMRIDLAILFAWRTVSRMRNSAATNLLIFDEVLDSSLDLAGIDEFIRIILTVFDQENIFIISHRGESIGDKFNNVLRFTKVQGYSKMVEAA
jgi:DNA repair exonuclease SbcCD ATPase subunit